LTDPLVLDVRVRRRGLAQQPGALVGDPGEQVIQAEPLAGVGPLVVQRDQPLAPQLAEQDDALVVAVELLGRRAASSSVLRTIDPCSPPCGANAWQSCRSCRIRRRSRRSRTSLTVSASIYAGTPNAITIPCSRPTASGRIASIEAWKSSGAIGSQ
jgi:hypothetical protein